MVFSIISVGPSAVKTGGVGGGGKRHRVRVHTQECESVNIAL